MFCMRLVAPGQLEPRVMENPTPGPEQALVRVAACGVGACDVAAFGSPLPWVKTPLVQGHEFAGTIAAAGNRVYHCKTGQRVCVEATVFCGKCHHCRSAHEYLCLDLKGLGVQLDGAFSEYVCVAADKLHPMPGEMPFEVGAMTEPTAHAIHAVRQSRLARGERAIVLGSDAPALLIAQLAKLRGAQVLVVAEQERQAALAKSLGADDAVACRDPKLAERVAALRGSRVIHVAFVSGHESAWPPDGHPVQRALEFVDKGGRVVLAGGARGPVSLSLGRLQSGELEMIGAAIYRREDFVEAFQQIQLRRVKVRELITHRFPLAQLADAYRAASDPSQGAVKVMVACA